MQSRLSPWLLCGVLAAMLAGTVHAYTAQLLEERRLFPRGWFP